MHPDLRQPPHILTNLVALFSETPPAPVPVPVEHLLVCAYCRGLMAVFHQAIEEAKEEQHRYAQQAAYAEQVVKRGTSEASRRYPNVVAHLEGCEACRENVGETIDYLRE